MADIMPIDHFDAAIEQWPLRTPFRIARGSKSEAAVVTVTLRSGNHVGRGEGCPYPRYGESTASVLAALRALDIAALCRPTYPEMRHALTGVLPAGSARNALDCALWDLEAKTSDLPVWQLAGLPSPSPLATCFTLSLDTPDAMAAAASRQTDCPLLKLKLGDAPGDPARMAAVRRTRPTARLVADANEGWTPDVLARMLTAAADNAIEVIEQPLPAGDDQALTAWPLAAGIALCADESAPPGAIIAPLSDRYQAVNIKLDKTGGFTTAINAIAEARRAGLRVMIGSMVATSLAMAPASLLGTLADWVDLDSPLLLASDRPQGMRIDNGMLSPPSPDLWG